MGKFKEIVRHQNDLSSKKLCTISLGKRISHKALITLPQCPDDFVHFYLFGLLIIIILNSLNNFFFFLPPQVSLRKDFNRIFRISTFGD
jgi:hypothetical protein